jgi:hypothetical protein
VVGVKDGLDQPLGLAQRDRLAIADEGEAAHLDLVPGGLGLGLGQAHAGHLRVAIGAAGDRIGLDRVGMVARDQFGHHHPLMAGLVRQPRRTGDIADGIEPLNPGAAISSVTTWVRSIFTPKRLQPQPFDIAHDADGGDHRIHLAGSRSCRRFQMRGHAGPHRAPAF